MSRATSAEASGIFAVVILFHPDDDAIPHIGRLAATGCPIVAVSNGISPVQADTLSGMDGVILVENPGNIGLARALNQGIGRFLESDAAFVLLLDQDSRLDVETIDALRRSAVKLCESGVRLGCVAPRLVDRKSPGATVGVTGEPLTVATSGSLLTREAVLRVGGMWDELFIDGIDHEWCFRARAMGCAVVVDNAIALAHDMGDAGIRIGGRYRPIHRSPVRHYHIVRNTLWMQRCRYIPLGWRLRELAKSFYRAPIYMAVSNDRKATALALWRAILDGFASPPSMPKVTA